MQKLAVLILVLSSIEVIGQEPDTLRTSHLDEVVITGQYEPQSAKKSLYQVKTIPLEKIAAKGAVRLQDVLNTELNIRFSQDLALGGSNMTMQGLAGQNVKVLIDGVPMVGRQGTTNEININQININAIERVEIIEGPMSVIYGADALAGVINIITKKSVDGKLELSAKIHEETVGSEYGVQSGIHNETLGLGYSRNHWRTRVDLSRNFFGGWQGSVDGRDKQWHPKNQYLASALIGYEVDPTDVYYRLDYLYEDIYNPGEFQGGEALDQHYFTNRFMHQVQGSHTFSDHFQFNGALAFTDYQRETQTTTVSESNGDIRLALGSGLQDVTDFHGLTVRGTFQYKWNEMISFQPGYDLNYETGSGGRIKEGIQTLGDYAAFVSAEWKPVTWLKIRPGLRFVHNSVYQAPPAIPSINTKWILNRKHDIRVSYGRGFRAPSLRELYFDFFDASHAIEGNTDLDAELSHSINGSWNWRLFERDRASVSSVMGAFYNIVDNMIGYGQKPGNILITTYLNIDQYKTKGFTWNNTWKNYRWEVSAGVAYTGRYNQLNESFNDTEAFAWSPEITTSIAYNIPKTDLNFSMYYKYTGITPYYQIITENGTSAAVLDELGDFHWADLSVQKNFKKHFSVAGGVRNLFDVINITNTATNSSGVHSGSGVRPVGYGRSYFFSITYSLPSYR